MAIHLCIRKREKNKLKSAMKSYQKGYYTSQKVLSKLNTIELAGKKLGGKKNFPNSFKGRHEEGFEVERPSADGICFSSHGNGPLIIISFS